MEQNSKQPESAAPVGSSEWLGGEHNLLMNRLREIMNEPELSDFITTPQYQRVCDAAKNGWPFILSKQSGGKYELIVEKPEAA